MAIYTLSTGELESLLKQTIKHFSDQRNVYDMSGNAAQRTIEAIMAQLEASQPQVDRQLENSLPYLDEEWEMKQELEKQMEYHLSTEPIPFQGEPTPYDSDDDGPSELGLQPEF